MTTNRQATKCLGVDQSPIASISHCRIAFIIFIDVISLLKTVFGEQEQNKSNLSVNQTHICVHSGFMLGRNSGFVARSFARFFFCNDGLSCNCFCIGMLEMQGYYLCIQVTLLQCGIFSLLSVVIQHVCCQAGVTFSLLCNNICHMSRYAERSHKSEKKR